jgi:hypothetical protein
MAARKTASALMAAESDESGRRVEGGGVMRTVDEGSDARDGNGWDDVGEHLSR